LRHLPLPLAPDTVHGSGPAADTRRGADDAAMGQRVGRVGVSTSLSAPDVRVWNAALLSTALDHLVAASLLTISKAFRPTAAAAAAAAAAGGGSGSGSGGGSGGGGGVQAQWFYKYWPYLPRLTSESAHVARLQSRLFEQLGGSALFLSTQGFVALGDVLMPVRPRDQSPSWRI